MTDRMASSAQDRLIVYVAVEDRACRAAIGDAVRRQGAAVLDYRTGFHLLGALADLIEGARPSERPGLLIVDAVSRGCSGLTIAAGLRDLDVRIPVVIIAKPGGPAVTSDDRLIRVVSERHAVSTIAELVRALSPARGSDVPEPAGTSPRDEGSR